VTRRTAPVSRNRFVRIAAACCVLAVFAPACAGSGGDVRDKSAQQWYDEGAKLVEKKKYPEAIEAFREAASTYRGADLDADIQIALADAYFGNEEYPAAAEAYGEFLRLHPHNARADYAQLRVALSWSKQMSGPERSPDAARKAAAAYEALLRGYPRSSHLDAAREGLVAARRSIADHELSVADFYRRTGSWRAAAGRYELVLGEYGDLGYTERVLYELGRCYEQLQEAERAAGLFERLRREFPQSRYLKELDGRKG